MSDLSVTDVQRMLREHAAAGHDILRDPKATYLGDPKTPSEPLRPFGIPLIHDLFPDFDLKNSVLYSTLMHGEQPTATRVASTLRHTSPKATLLYRKAVKLHPRTTEQGGDKDYSSFTTYPAPHEDEPAESVGVFDSTQTPNNYYYGVDEDLEPLSPGNIHDALKAQASTPPLYTFRESKTSTHKNTGNWDLFQALEHESHPLDPFSGLIHINHISDMYSYNPKTEQLRRLD